MMLLEVRKQLPNQLLNTWVWPQIVKVLIQQKLSCMSFDKTIIHTPHNRTDYGDLVSSATFGVFLTFLQAH